MCNIWYNIYNNIYNIVIYTMYSCILYICMYVCIWPAAKLNSVFDVAYRARFMNIDRLPLMRGIDCGTFAGSDSSIRSVSIPAPNASSLVCRNVHTSDSFFVLSFSPLFCSHFFFTTSLSTQFEHRMLRCVDP